MFLFWHEAKHRASKVLSIIFLRLFINCRIELGYRQRRTVSAVRSIVHRRSWKTPLQNVSKALLRLPAVKTWQLPQHALRQNVCILLERHTAYPTPWWRRVVWAIHRAPDSLLKPISGFGRNVHPYTGIIERQWVQRKSLSISEQVI